MAGLNHRLFFPAALSVHGRSQDLCHSCSNAGSLTPCSTGNWLFVFYLSCLFFDQK